MVLLDTHVLVWLDEANPRLGAGAIKKIDAAFQAGNVMVSAISFWEIATLIRKGRVRLDMDLSVWRKDLLEQGLLELPVMGEIGIKAAALDPFHGDPADRLIAATALQHSLTLISADKKLLSSPLAISRMDACSGKDAM